MDFLAQEQEAMLQEFWEFDRKLIHENYRNIVEKIEGQASLIRRVFFDFSAEIILRKVKVLARKKDCQYNNPIAGCPARSHSY